jgi:hypothetical protein
LFSFEHNTIDFYTAVITLERDHTLHVISKVNCSKDDASVSKMENNSIKHIFFYTKDELIL